MPYTKAQTEVINTVTRYINIANKHFDSDISVPLVKFDIRGQNLAGQAQYSNWTVRFHMGYLEGSTEQYLKRTVPHEVAHLIANKIYKRGPLHRIMPHGKEWKFIMRKVFGLPASRCHNYPIPEGYEKNSRTFTYACNCQDFQLTIVRHNKMQKGKALYSCTKCKETLTYKRRVSK